MSVYYEKSKTKEGLHEIFLKMFKHYNKGYRPTFTNVPIMKHLLKKWNELGWIEYEEIPCGGLFDPNYFQVTLTEAGIDIITFDKL